MAQESIHKQEFAIRHLSTRSVTLYPARAQVIRDINDVALQPGANEITIYGLTPTADETSIKVDGKGSATITDMMVDLIPNRDEYEDVYPPESDSEDSDVSMDDGEDFDSQSETIKALLKESMETEHATKIAKEEKASATSRLAMLESFGRSMEKDRPNDVAACIETYTEERQKAFDVHIASEARIKKLEEERAKIQKRQSKALRTIAKEMEKAKKEEVKNLEKKNRKKREKLEAKRQLKDERIQFWPRKVYRVVLSLDTNNDMTPVSSRRGSIDSLAKTLSEDSSGSCQISLSISYITHSAYWSPRYDLSLNTPTNSGLITYRAEFCNSTSETWKDAKVILSTSETSFQGLGEPVPSMVPWHIRLNKAFGKDIDSTSGALLSSHEVQCRQRGVMNASSKASEPRNVLFGLGSNNGSNPFPPPRGPQNLFGAPAANQQQQQAAQYQVQANQASTFGSQPQQMHMGAPLARGGGLFGSATRNSASNQTAFGNAAAQSDPSQSKEDVEYDPTIEDTNVPDLPSLATQESEWSESGLTATYDIPGVRTITPSFTTRRHKIANITLKEIHLSYLLVPKLRAAAFLKARIRNTSSTTLLRGPVGLTLDGSFLGNASLPRCSAGDALSLSLGVDPSLNVTYAKPVVKRSQTGVFQKEGTGVYTRTCTITNTKSNRAVEGLVLDQIPISEDERLRVEVLQPSGLWKEGDTARSGLGIAAAGKVAEKWGRATAILKKGGEVCWDLRLEPGRAVKLVLEYEARFPSSDLVVVGL
ncbi:hypothetical protein P7C71_g2133, partial [Lecanoromycetidae sp. Uapishka_2]